MSRTHRWMSSLSGGMRSLFTLSSWGTRRPWKVESSHRPSAASLRWSTVRGGGGVTPRGPRDTGRGARAA